MKKFYKIAAIVAGVALCLAFVLGLAGFCTGGTVNAAEKLVPGNLAHFDFPFFWFGDDDKEDSEEYVDNRQEESDGWKDNHNDWDDAYDADRYDDWYEGKEDDITENQPAPDEEAKGYFYENVYTDEIRKLEWNIDYGDVTVKTGENFSIKAGNMYEEGFSSQVKDGVWYIDCKLKMRQGKFNSFFTKYAEIEITVPENTILYDASINIGMSDVVMSDLTFKEAEITVGMGEAELSGIVIEDEGEISIGQGETHLENFVGKDVTIDCGLGTVSGDATITGESEFTCGIGTIELELTGEETDYNYELSCGIGSIKLGNDSYSGVTDKEIRNGAKNSIEMDCGIGTIEVRFQ